MPKATAAPMAPTPTPTTIRSITHRVGPAGSKDSAMAISKRNSVSSAPSGSMMTPSLASTVLMRSLTRTLRRSGVMTLGPVTTTSAPNSSATRQPKSRNTNPANAPTSVVITSPPRTRFRTVGASSRNMGSRRTVPPSKTMRATANVTETLTRSSISAVSTIPRPSWPSSKPAASRNTGSGMGNRREPIFPRAAAPAMTAAARRATSISTGASYFWFGFDDPAATRRNPFSMEAGSLARFGAVRLPGWIRRGSARQ